MPEKKHPKCFMRFLVFGRMAELRREGALFGAQIFLEWLSGAMLHLPSSQSTSTGGTGTGDKEVSNACVAVALDVGRIPFGHLRKCQIEILLTSKMNSTPCFSSLTDRPLIARWVIDEFRKNSGCFGSGRPKFRAQPYITLTGSPANVTLYIKMYKQC